MYRSLNRPNLLLGCERELVLTTGLLSFTLIFAALSWPAAIIGVSIWLCVVGLLRQMAKADPNMSTVYTRHVKYQKYYPAHSKPYRES